MIKRPNTIDKGMVLGFVKPLIRHGIALISSKAYWRYHLLCSMLPETKEKSLKKATWGKNEIYFLDRTSFLSNLAEIFINRAYSFGPFAGSPRIIDCGSNVGLASLYWQTEYCAPNIVAFEADPNLELVARKNLTNWGVNFQLIQAALSDVEGTAWFESNLCDSGRLLKDRRFNAIEVPLKRLSPYIDERVDLLKIDIEGAELEVLQECSSQLNHVDRIFVECHSFENGKQALPEVCNILDKAEFRINVFPGVLPKPAWAFHANQSSGIVNSVNIVGIKSTILAK